MPIAFAALADVDAEIEALTRRLAYLKQYRRWVTKNPPPGDAPLLDHLEAIAGRDADTEDDETTTTNPSPRKD